MSELQTMHGLPTSNQLLVDRVPEMKPKIIGNRYALSNYNRDTKTITVRELSKAQGDGNVERFNFVHEYGHAMDDGVVGSATKEALLARGGTEELWQAITDFRQAVMDSDGYSTLQAINNERFVKYASSADEMWARAYSQWAAERMGGEVEAGMKFMLAKFPELQWAPEDFAPIRAAVEKILDERGLLIDNEATAETAKAAEEAAKTVTTSLPSHDDWLSSLRAEYPEVKLEIVDHAANGDYLSLDKIIVPKELRNQGVGSEIMQKVLDRADALGKPITLTPSTDFGGTKAGLDKFYKSFGFVRNTGGNALYESTDAMVRYPNPEKLFKPSESKLIEETAAKLPTPEEAAAKAAHDAGFDVHAQTLEEIGGKPFMVSEDGFVDLYHVAPRESANLIESDGLKQGDRRYPLTSNPSEAVKIGQARLTGGIYEPDADVQIVHFRVPRDEAAALFDSAKIQGTENEAIGYGLKGGKGTLLDTRYLADTTPLNTVKVAIDAADVAAKAAADELARVAAIEAEKATNAAATKLVDEGARKLTQAESTVLREAVDKAGPAAQMLTRGIGVTEKQAEELLAMRPGQLYDIGAHRGNGFESFTDQGGHHALQFAHGDHPVVFELQPGFGNALDLDQVVRRGETVDDVLVGGRVPVAGTFEDKDGVIHVLLGDADHPSYHLLPVREDMPMGQWQPLALKYGRNEAGEGISTDVYRNRANKFNKQLELGSHASGTAEQYKSQTARGIAERMRDVPTEDMRKMLDVSPYQNGYGTYERPEIFGRDDRIALKVADRQVINDINLNTLDAETRAAVERAIGNDGAVDMKKLRSNLEGVDYAGKHAGDVGTGPHALREIQRGYEGYSGALTKTAAADMLEREQYVSDLIQHWAHTSNDKDLVSLAVQESAREQFQLHGTFDWAKVVGDDTMKNAMKMYVDNKTTFDTYVREMYNNTQAALRAKGYGANDLVPLIRGQSGLTLSSQAGGLGEQSLSMRPMSSFAAGSIQTAAGFGGGELMAVNVPASWIIGFPGYGVGCQREYEVVVLGGKVDVFVLRR